MDPEAITEEVTRAWYKNGPPLPPAKGVTEPLDNARFDYDGKYSWFKAPAIMASPWRWGPWPRC